MYIKERNASKLWNLSAVFALFLALPFATHGQAGLSATAKAAPISSGSGIQLRVECGNPKAPLKSIGAALKLVGNFPATLLISGTCHENVVIQGLDRITLQGNPTATIDGGNDPNFAAVDIIDSVNIGLTNLTITGGAGVFCAGHSLCRLIQSTVQNSLGVGVSVCTGCYFGIGDSVIQNNGDIGLYVGAGTVSFFGGFIQDNAGDGVRLRYGGVLNVQGGSLIPTVTIHGNAGNGITAIAHSIVALDPATITNNSGDGVRLMGGSTMRTSGSTIAFNSGHQVRIGDLSWVQFSGDSITGPNYPDVVCDPLFSTTRGLGNLAGSTSNCPAELPPTP
jgi:hypothetical protein